MIFNKGHMLLWQDVQGIILRHLFTQNPPVSKIYFLHFRSVSIFRCMYSTLLQYQHWQIKIEKEGLWCTDDGWHTVCTFFSGRGALQEFHNKQKGINMSRAHWKQMCDLFLQTAGLGCCFFPPLLNFITSYSLMCSVYLSVWMILYCIYYSFPLFVILGSWQHRVSVKMLCHNAELLLNSTVKIQKNYK